MILYSNEVSRFASLRSMVLAWLATALMFHLGRYESVEAALVFSVDEELVYAFDVVFFFAGDYES